MKPHRRIATGHWLQPHLKDAGYAKSPRIQSKLTELGITLTDVHHVVTRGSIVWADEVNFGVHFTAHGETCDDVSLSVCAWYDHGTLVIDLIEVF